MLGQVEAVLYGALATGVNKPTAILINLVLLALLASLLLLLSVVWNEAPEAVPHVAFLLLLFGGLAAAVNWFLANVGLADVAAQRAELNLDGDAGGSKPQAKKEE
eukprot:jgi/Tetstr1/463115/TSEL_008049.t1